MTGWKGTLRYVVAAVAFAAAYGQAPLYYSNQNQYFLHGFALADQGLLRKDWLAGTLDPTPLFSRLTAWTMTCLDPRVFHLFHALLMGIYAAAMLDIFLVLQPQLRRWLAFAFLLVLVHGAGLRWLSYHGLGLDYAWYFQGGVASQYLLGAMFQPSVFGVFLVAGISCFLRDRLVPASLCVAAAATMHNTYLLPGAMLTAGFFAQLALEKRWRAGVIVALPTLVLVLPTVVCSLATFGPTTPEQFARSQEILVHDRIPHHCIVARWLDVPALLQILWVLGALTLVWKTRLFVVMALCTALAGLLTVVQVVSGSDLLALLFPWRISTVLVPLATTVVLGRVIGIGGHWLEDFKGVQIASAAGLVILAAAGVGISVGRLAFPIQADDLPLLYFVHDHKEKGDVYLLPVKVPKRGQASTSAVRALNGDFKPMETQKDTRLIPLDLQQFRLSTEAPIFVDFKSIPYKDVEVIEWYERLVLAEKVQELLKKGEVSSALAELAGRHVTHVVTPTNGKVLSDSRLRLVYPAADDTDVRYRVYKIVD